VDSLQNPRQVGATELNLDQQLVGGFINDSADADNGKAKIADQMLERSLMGRNDQGARAWPTQGLGDSANLMDITSNYALANLNS